MRWSDYIYLSLIISVTLSKLSYDDYTLKYADDSFDEGLEVTLRPATILDDSAVIEFINPASVPMGIETTVTQGNGTLTFYS